MEYIKELQGHSRARVVLYNDAGVGYFVRKSALDVSYNLRLEQQCRKMLRIRDDVVCPGIIREGYIDGLYYYDMDYISGGTVAHELINNTQTFDEQALIDRLTIVLQGYKSKKTGVISPDAVRDKLSKVYGDALKNSVLGGMDSHIRHIYKILNDYKWNDIEQTECHGDMTLENIIYSEKKEFVFIDFDCVDLSSAFFDYCKIMQDVSGQWFLRKMAVDETMSICFLSTLIHLESLEKKLFLLGKRLFLDNIDDVKAGVCLHLMRTLPYMKDRKNAEFVIKRLIEISKNIVIV